jgi:hypothetical protein
MEQMNKCHGTSPKFGSQNMQCMTEVRLVELEKAGAVPYHQ